MFGGLFMLRMHSLNIVQKQSVCFNLCFDYCRNSRSYSALLKHLLYIVNFSTEQLLATV